ncbi:Hypothetical protein TART1_1072 [Trichococcus shcherbakoviae]|uniref:Uncharacterized protein n=1 Tax=Trichococcus shcherbakoviae TaxID=2094020 RepID=A0A383TE88_9LACT|nr:Hypothetical protein TART1_1072 [Trichococcus shcherbakoviae]
MSSNEAAAARRRALLQLPSSGERMLAGGGSMAGGCTSAKPRWSEVIIFLGILPPQRTPLPEENVSSDVASAHRRTALRQLVSFGEQMLAGGGCIAGVCNTAKPRWSEVMIFLGILPRQRTPLPEENVSSDVDRTHRRTGLRRLPLLRRANAGRR